jgi:outer membrane protein insertion porin family
VAEPLAAIAVQPPPGRTAGEYLKLVRQPLGQPLRADLVRRSLRALFATGEFANLEAIADPLPSGLKLLFATRPNYFLSLVKVEGSPNPPASTELEDASNLNLGEVYSPAAVNAAATAVRARLRSYGYFHASVTPHVALRRASAQAVVTFLVQAGPLARLGQVTFTGDLAASVPRLWRAARLRPGQTLSRERLDAAVSRLESFYARQGRLAAQIHLGDPLYRPAANRADLHFTISAGPLVTVATQGMSLSPGVLRAQVPVYEEHATDLALIEEGRANLIAYLQRQGYFRAQVRYRRQTSPGALRIVYLIRSGPKETLDFVGFSGYRYFDVDDLSEHIAVRAASPWPRLLPGERGLFSTALAHADAEAISQLYRNNGFLNVEVTPVVNHDWHGHRGHIAVVYRIVEGPQTLVSKVQILGAGANRSALAAQLATAPGQPFSLASLASDRNAILTWYFNAGYQGATCDVRTRPVNPDAGPDRQDVTFTIHQGQRQFIHSVIIAGNHFVHTNVIADRLTLRPGAPLSQSAMLASQRRLDDTGLFTSANVVARNPAGSESAKDVFVSVNEARRYTFSEGVGLQVQGGTGGPSNLNDILGSTGFSPLFSFDMTRTAMTGRNQTLALKSTYGSLEKRAVLAYDFPDFLNHSNWQADATTFYDDTFDVRTFQAIRVEAGLQLQQNLNPAANWTYNLDYRRVRVLHPLVAPQEIPVLSQPVQIAELAASYRVDHRDNPLDTHSGTFNSFSLAIAKTFSPGFADFARLDYQNHWYRPLGDEGNVVLANSTQVGVELPFGSTANVGFINPITGVAVSSLQHVIPLPERYLSGGSDSLRGFAINQAGPRDPVTGFPVGGDAQFIDNLELRFPLVGPNIGGVVFYDLGNVYSTPRNMLRDFLRTHPVSSTDQDFTSHTLGVGLRYRTPVGPVRLDTGYLLNAPTFQYFSTGAHPVVLNQSLPPFHFFFSIGQTF